MDYDISIIEHSYFLVTRDIARLKHDHGSSLT